MAPGDQRQGSLKRKRSNSSTRDSNEKRIRVVEPAQNPEIATVLTGESNLQPRQYTHQHLDAAREQTGHTGSEVPAATSTKEEKVMQKTASHNNVSEESDSQATESEGEIERREAGGKHRAESDATISDSEANDLLDREAEMHDVTQSDLGHYEGDLENDEWDDLAEAARLSRQQAERADTATAGPSHAGGTHISERESDTHMARMLALIEEAIESRTGSRTR
ncbi:MAG: hypothetical protein Q9212_006636 [Teloschistes hypoglaucus]